MPCSVPRIRAIGEYQGSQYLVGKAKKGENFRFPQHKDRMKAMLQYYRRRNN